MLNKAYLPIDVINWEDAMSFWARDRCDIIHHYEDEKLRVRSPEQEDGSKQCDMVCPSVIRLKEGETKQYRLIKPKSFDRNSLYKEYNGICCYCGKSIDYKDYTIEHIIPKSRGGLNTWENIAPCHKICNMKKGSMTVKEAGLKLHYEVKNPFEDDLMPRTILNKVGGVIPSESWRQYIYWSKEIE